VRFQARAAVEVAEIDAWWRTHRNAGNLFASELAETRYHVYFRVVADTLEVLAVWHAKRQPPRL
jgi:plasmid stabilization system protein ParE